MLFWIFVILLVVGIMILVVGNRVCEAGIVLLGLVVTVTGVLAVLISLSVMIEENIEADAKVAEYKMRYESLVYQYENELYDNDNDVGKRELMADIEWWNSDLANRKAKQNNFWVGIYIPDIYDEFEFIELKPMPKE